MKKKLYVVSLIILIIINMLTISVSAEGLSFTTTMTPSNTKIEPGTEVVVSVKVSSLEVGDEGINTFTALLGYDVSIFEPLTEPNVEGSNDWKAVYATGTGKITLTKTTFTNSDEEIMQIILKVKSDAEKGAKGTVSLTNILAANPSDEISSSNISTTITVGEDSGSGSTQTPNGIVISPSNNAVVNGTNNNVANNLPNNGTITPISNSNNNTNNTVNDANNVVDNQTEEEIPYTGSETTDFMKIIVGVIIIALLLYRKIYSLEDV